MNPLLARPPLAGAPLPGLAAQGRAAHRLAGPAGLRRRHRARHAADRGAGVALARAGPRRRTLGQPAPQHPLMVQLLLWYFGVAGLLPEAAMLWLNSPRSLPLPGGLALPWPSFEFLAALVGLTLYSASFICGELQAGLRGVAAGQRQAARALGMNGWQEFRWVVLPQAGRWRADR